MSSIGNVDTVVIHMDTNPDWLAAAAASTPDAPFITTPERSWSFAQVDEAAAGLAGALREAGAAQDEIVAVWATNDIGSTEAIFAVPRTGATLLLLNTRLSPPELEAQLAQAGVEIVVSAEHDHGFGGRTIVSPSSRAVAVPGSLLRHEHEAVVAFTSGTSGSPRGVILTQGNLAASTEASARHLRHSAADRWLAVLPLFHVGGASILWRSARQGSEVVLLPRFEPAEAAAALHEVTLASLVGSMIGPLLAADPGPYSGLRAVLVGGGPTSLPLLEAAARAGLPVLSTYGMTETASQIATAPLGDSRRRRALPVYGARIRIAAGGEIEVAGPMVSGRYLGEKPRSGWLATGDLGWLDGEGYLHVLGRTRDLIITGGENVVPGEVEALLEELDGVQEAAVVGVPDPEWGEAVVAVAVTSRRPAELEAHLREQLAGYKIPKRWVLVEALPRNALGKVDRPAVRAWAGAADG